MGFATNVPNPDEIHPTSFPVNEHPLAPNPMGPVPQSDTYLGGAQPAPGGREAAFSMGQGESLGAVHHVQTQLFGRQSDAPEQKPLWQSKTLPSATPREDASNVPANGTTVAGMRSTQYGPGLE
jgi:hypothetical protein